MNKSDYKTWIFLIYRKSDGMLILDGNYREAAYFMDCESPIIFLQDFVNRKYLRNKEYRVVAKTPKGNKIDIEKRKYEIPKEDCEYDYLVRHLSKYGNTVLNRDPSIYLDKLRNDGYSVEVTCYPERWYNVNYAEKWLSPEHYILKVVKE